MVRVGARTVPPHENIRPYPPLSAAEMLSFHQTGVPAAEPEPWFLPGVHAAFPSARSCPRVLPRSYRFLFQAVRIRTRNIP